MKLFSLFKSSKFLIALVIIVVLCGIIYYVWNKREGIPTDSNLITTTNPYLIPPDSALGRTNTLVMRFKDQISSQITQVNALFDANGILKPESVTMITESIKQAAKTANPTVNDSQLNSMITPNLVKEKINKQHIKTFLDNVIDLVTLIKQGLN